MFKKQLQCMILFCVITTHSIMQMDMFKKSVAVADISNYAKNVTRCLIWEKTGTCDLKVDAKVTN